MLLALLPASAAASPLTGTSWRVARVDGNIVSRSAHERLAFPTGRDFTGHGTCGNDFGGRYRATATRLRFDARPRRRVWAASGPSRRPTSPAVVNRTRRYRITGRTLELLGRRGRTLAVLKRR